MTTPTGPPYFWLRHLDDEGQWTRGEPPPGHLLTALRSGLGREPGSVPAMWPHYVHLGDGPEFTGARQRAKLLAEHTALALYGMHQQSQARPMHRSGIGVGEAIRYLVHTDRFSAEAVHARFLRAATADHVDEVATHLRGLVSMLKTLPVPGALDYSRLVGDLTRWQDPTERGGVRRRWGAQYHRRIPSTTSKEKS